MGKMTAEKASRVVELYQKYGTGVTVAEQLDVTLYMVYKHLRLNGIEPKKNGTWQQKADMQIMADLYLGGKSLTQIALQLNMNPGSICERLQNAGIPLRDKVEGQVLAGYKKRGSDEEIIVLYNSGMNCKQISDHYGLKNSKAEIARILHRHGIKPEVRGERSPHWKGGKLELNKMVRNCAHYVNWRTEIFKDRDYTCEITGQRGGKLNVHHKKPLAELLDEFMVVYPNVFASQEARLKAIETFQPFWDKANVLVVTEEMHRQIHTNLISV